MGRIYDKNIIGHIFLMLWVITLSAQSSHTHTHIYSVPDGLPSLTIQGLQQDTHGYIWVKTDEGTVRFDGLNFESIRIPDTLRDSWQQMIETDREGNTWLFKEGKGLFCEYTAWFTDVSDQKGFPLTTVYDWAEDKQGNIWAATRQGLYVWKDNEWSAIAFPNIPSLGYLEITALSLSPTGKLYGVIQTQRPKYNGVYMLNHTPRFAASEHGKNLYTDQRGYHWMWEGNMLIQFAPDFASKQTWDRIPELSDPSISIIAVYRDTKERLFIGTNKGVWIWNKSQVLHFTTQNGLNHNQINAIAEDSTGHIWFATERGLCKWGNTGMTSYINDASYTQNKFRSLAITPDGIWAGAVSGLVFFHKDGTSISYNNHNRLPDAIAHTLLLSQKQQLWIGTEKGASLLKQPLSPPQQKPPILHLNDIQIDNATLSSSENISFSYNQRLSLRYTALQYTQQENLLYTYRTHQNDFWQPLQASDAESPTQGTIYFDNLRAGKYQFQIKARLPNSAWGKVATLDFKVVGLWWQSMWTLLWIFLLIISIAGLLAWLRIRYIRNKANTKLALSRRIADLESSALNAQMNPHFVFNSLSAIQHFILQNNQRAALKYLSTFSKLLRRVLENSRHGLITLEEEIETLKLYLELEQLRFGDKFNYTFTVSPKLPVHELYIPPMLVQPFIENAIRHGLKHLENRKGILTIEFEKLYPFIYCRIEDNGIGRQAAKAIKSQNHTEYQSRGMELSQGRLDTLGVIYDVENHIRIVDMKDPSDKPTGTKVEIRIPLDLK